jgi:hypothetical protein
MIQQLTASQIINHMGKLLDLRKWIKRRQRSARVSGQDISVEVRRRWPDLDRKVREWLVQNAEEGMR